MHKTIDHITRTCITKKIPNCKLFAIVSISTLIVFYSHTYFNFVLEFFLHPRQVSNEHFMRQKNHHQTSLNAILHACKHNWYMRYDMFKINNSYETDPSTGSSVSDVLFSWFVDNFVVQLFNKMKHIHNIHTCIIFNLFSI